MRAFTFLRGGIGVISALFFLERCFVGHPPLPQGERATSREGYEISDGLTYDFELYDIRAQVEGSSVTIQWRSEYPATSIVEWGLQDPSDNRFERNNYVTDHAVTLHNLPEGRYFYRVNSRTRDGRFAQLDNLRLFSFEIRIYPQISGLTHTTNQSAKSVTISFTTDRPAIGRIELGTDTTYSLLQTEESDLTQTHTLTLTLPAYGTTYYYRVIATDEQGDSTINDNSGAGYTVSIPEPAPPPPPDGTHAKPFIIDTANLTLTNPIIYTHSYNSSYAHLNSIFNKYNPATQNEYGREVVYKFDVSQSVRFRAELISGYCCTPDNDLHLLSSLSHSSGNANLYNNDATFRNDRAIPALGSNPNYKELPAGTYYLVIDGYGSDTSKNGPYTLRVELSISSPVHFTINIGTLPYTYTDSRNTANTTPPLPSDNINSYPPYPQNESGPEYVYEFTVPAGMRYKVTATLSSMPSGTDIDIHLLSSLNPLQVISRNDVSLTQTLEAGTYYLVADTYVTSAGVEKKGPYTLTVQFQNVTPPSQRVVQGYLTYWSSSTTGIQWNRLTHLLYFCLEPNADGSIKSLHGWDTTPAVTVAKNNGVKVLISVCLFGSSNIATMVNSPANRARMIQNIKNQILARGAHGVDLDFEVPGSSARTGLATFVQELRSALNALGNAPDGQPYRIHMALMPIDWANAYDMQAITPHIDYAMVMAYDGHSANSPQAGPTNKLYSPRPPWSHPFSFQYFFDHWLNKMGSANAPKLLGGIGYYLRDYATAGFTIPSANLGSQYVITRTYATVIPMVKSVVADGVTRILGYDSTIHNPYYFYKQDNQHRQIWYDTKASLKIKYDYIKSRNMGGIGIWALGFDRGVSETWEAIAESWW
ncbi:MAG: glycoside hydrolase family 18 protein [Leptospiraceae bacterium]|nr:glycoside hydrolase family 18 protein [Leptospiraceae bacterium]MDW8306315.1 glycoside hydrolase family 18 protein [Leptospiraceae bacterium]